MSLGVSTGDRTGTTREVYGSVLATLVCWHVLGSPLRLRGRPLCTFACTTTTSSGALWTELIWVLPSPLRPRGRTGVFRRSGVSSPQLIGCPYAGHLRGRCHAGTAAGGTVFFRGSVVPSSSTLASALRHSVHVPGLTGGFRWEDDEDCVGPSVECLAHLVLSWCTFVQVFFQYATSRTVSSVFFGERPRGVAGHNQDQRFLRVPERGVRAVTTIRS